MNDGVITQNVTSEGYREGLRFLRTLFSNGLFGEESFTQPMPQIKQQVEGGDAPTIGVVIAGAHSNFSNIGGDRWIKYVAVPSLIGPSGLQQAPFNPWGVGSGQCVINARTEHPVAAFKWCDGLYDRETTCAPSSASRSGKRLRAKPVSGAGQKRASQPGRRRVRSHLAASVHFRLAAKCPLGAARSQLPPQPPALGRGAPR